MEIVMVVQVLYTLCTSLLIEYTHPLIVDISKTLIFVISRKSNE